MCWVRSRKHSPMPTPERRRYNILPGQLRFPGTVAIARCQLFRVPAAGTERHDGQFQGNRGNLRRQAVKSSGGVSDQLIRGDKSGGFARRCRDWSLRKERSASKARRSWSLLLVPWPGEASRPFSEFHPGCARSCLTVSPVCGRRNVTIAFRVACEAVRDSEVKRAQSWRVRPKFGFPSGRRRNRAEAWCEARAQVSARCSQGLPFDSGNFLARSARTAEHL
jgi:hypothetical protein